MITIEKLYELYLQYPSVQTDSRKVAKGDLFFALKGDTFNGNQFAEQALASGAALAIIDEMADPGKVPDRIIQVDHALETLQALAKHHREQFDIPFLAITGSNGKTTTKELVHAVLSESYRTYTTQGNLNNHIGIPLTLLKIKPDAQMAVIEMGANHVGEIRSYCNYTLPTHGIITNCGKAHLEGFGSIEGVRKAKGELYDFLKSHQGTAILMWDYEYLREMSQGIHQVVTYGKSGGSVRGRIISSQPFLSVQISIGREEFGIESFLVGEYNLPNILAAVAVGWHFGVPSEMISQAIAGYRPSNSRSQLLEYKNNQVILDAYNANPTSMRAAIEHFAQINAPRKILILGAMAELGRDSLAEHQQILELINRYRWEDVILVGGDFIRLAHPYRSFPNSQEAGQWVEKQNFRDTYWLVKGSRSVQMEKIVRQ
jgi:UDP-N-acetylmuramoyl-tripeptide--D-alanyl-D-alanine ligase